MDKIWKYDNNLKRWTIREGDYDLIFDSEEEAEKYTRQMVDMRENLLDNFKEMENRGKNV